MRKRFAAALAIGIVCLVASAGAVGALEGCDNSGENCNGGGGGSRNNRSNRATTTTTLVTEVLPNQLVTQQPEEQPVLAFTDDAPATSPTSGSLPFTGGDVAGMVVIGAAAVGIGAVMVRRSRTRTAE